MMVAFVTKEDNSALKMGKKNYAFTLEEEEENWVSFILTHGYFWA